MQVQRVLEHRHAYVCLAALYRQIAEEGVSKNGKGKSKAISLISGVSRDGISAS
jgi:hypothetical protein